MAITRLEIDVKRLLSVCEEMAQNNSSDDWRLSKVNIIFYYLDKSLGFKFHIFIKLIYKKGFINFLKLLLINLFSSI